MSSNIDGAANSLTANRSCGSLTMKRRAQTLAGYNTNLKAQRILNPQYQLREQPSDQTLYVVNLRRAGNEYCPPCTAGASIDN